MSDGQPTIPTPTCRICHGPTTWLATKRSAFSGRAFDLARCADCRYVFVTDPRTDYENLYDEAYYSGRGADRHVDYEQEMADRRTIRLYEWRGILRAVGSVVPLTDHTRWLDFGCGLGGFVRYARSRGLDVVGYEQGYAAARARELGIPLLDDLTEAAESFDVITATEMIEHAVTPVAELETMAALLRPGGTLFLHTGNAEPHRDQLSDWEYLAPIDVHVGVFEPTTMARALQLAGLEPEWPGYRPGHVDIIRHKVLKALNVEQRRTVYSIVPWPLASRVVDWRHGVSRHPIGRKPTASSAP
jgi:SAM-dependent methyltransferase